MYNEDFVQRIISEHGRQQALIFCQLEAEKNDIIVREFKQMKNIPYDQYMDYDYELLKDIIIENDPEIKREDINIDNIIDSVDNYLKGDYIIVDFTIMIIKNIHGYEKVFSKGYIHSIFKEQYDQRLKEKLRDENLGKLGI